MKPVNSCCVKQALVAAVMAACTSFAAQAGEPASIDRNVLAQVMALHGLDERGAIERLAAEEDAADLYRRVRSMNLPGYAGAWFDAGSGTLHVALSDPAQAGLLALPASVPRRMKGELTSRPCLQPCNPLQATGAVDSSASSLRLRSSPPA